MNKIASLPKIALLLPLLLGSHAMQAASPTPYKVPKLEFEHTSIRATFETSLTLATTAIGTLIALITALGWGNKLLKVRITTKDGKKAGFGKRLGYTTLFLLPLMPLIGHIIFEITEYYLSSSKAIMVTLPFFVLSIGIPLAMIIWNIVLMGTRGRTLFEHATQTHVIDVKKSTFNEDGSTQTTVKARWGKRIGAAALSMLFGGLIIGVPTLCCLLYISYQATKSSRMTEISV